MARIAALLFFSEVNRGDVLRAKGNVLSIGNGGKAAHRNDVPIGLHEYDLFLACGVSFENCLSIAIVEHIYRRAGKDVDEGNEVVDGDEGWVILGR